MDEKEVFEYVNKLYNIDKSELNKLDIKYHNIPVHLALEKSDTLKDWSSFKMILNINKDLLTEHLDVCDGIFKFNYKKLSKKEKQNLFN